MVRYISVNVVAQNKVPLYYHFFFCLFSLVMVLYLLCHLTIIREPGTDLLKLQEALFRSEQYWKTNHSYIVGASGT